MTDITKKKRLINSLFFVVDRGIEPLCQDWESCILTIRWIDQHFKVTLSVFAMKSCIAFKGNPLGLRKEGDSNPRYGNPYGSLANCWFQPLTHPSLRTWSQKPWGYLLDCGCKGNTIFWTLQIFKRFFSLLSLFSLKERNTGLEPATLGLGSQCSTNWANSACVCADVLIRKESDLDVLTLLYKVSR